MTRSRSRAAGSDGPSLDEHCPRLGLLADAYGIPVDDALLAAIEAAVGWLRAKGVREEWPSESLAQLEDEASWLAKSLDTLR